MSLLHPSRPDAPHLDRLTPHAAIPGGSFELFGSHLLSHTNDGPQLDPQLSSRQASQPGTPHLAPQRAGSPATPQLPSATFGDTPAFFDLVRPTRALLRVPDGAIASDLTLHANGAASNPLHANIAVSMADELHLVANPALDADGNLFAMISGPRGERVPISIVRIGPDFQASPFVRDLLNVSALAFDRTGYLYASSRAEGTVYRISPEGAISTFAEGMGIATGLAFDRDGNLFVGDRSGTIFKIGPYGSRNPGEVFVFATLEPSIAAYHLAFRDDGTLLVTAPNTSSNQAIYAISPHGDTTVFYSGLGRPQGMALDTDGNLYVAAALHGRRGIIRLWPSLENPATPNAELFIAGNDLVGLCFLDEGCAALATNNTLFHVDLAITGRPLV